VTSKPASTVCPDSGRTVAPGAEGWARVHLHSPVGLMRSHHPALKATVRALLDAGHDRPGSILLADRARFAAALAGDPTLFGNPAMLTLLGCPDIDAVLASGWRSRDFYHQLARAIDAWTDLDGPLPTFEARLRRQDGRMVPALVTAVPEDDGSGWYVSTLVDATAIVESRAALERREQHFRAVFEESVVPQVMFDGRLLKARLDSLIAEGTTRIGARYRAALLAEGKTTGRSQSGIPNAAARRLLGVDADGVFESALHLRWDYLGDLCTSLDGWAPGQPLPPFETTLWRTDGQAVRVVLATAPVRGHEQDWALCQTSMTDVTAQRAAEAAALAERERADRQWQALFDAGVFPQLSMDASPLARVVKSLRAKGVDNPGTTLLARVPEQPRARSHLGEFRLNRAALALFGIDSAEQFDPDAVFTRRYYEDFLPILDHAEFDGDSLKVCQTFETRLRRADGSGVDVLAIVGPSQGHESDWSHAVCTFIDISAQKAAEREAERARTESQQSWQALFDASATPQAFLDISSIEAAVVALQQAGHKRPGQALLADRRMLVTTMRAVRVLNQNSALNTLLRIEPGPTFEPLAHLRLEFMETLAGVLDGWAPGRALEPFETTVHRSDGAQVIARVQIRPLDPACLDWSRCMVSVTDLTAQRAAERDARESLERAEAHWRSLFESSAIAQSCVDNSSLYGRALALAESGVENVGRALFTDTETLRTLLPEIRVIRWNDEAARLFGLAEGEAYHIGRHAGPEYLADLTEAMDGWRPGLPIPPFETVLNRADGSRFWVRITIRLVSGYEHSWGMCTITYEDLTPQKQAEQALVAARDEAEAANRAKSAFLATMSHEIRTPMNGVLGSAEILRRTMLDPDQRGHVETLIDCGEQLLAILNDILDISKIEAGRMELAPVPTAPGPLVSQAAAFWRARAQDKGLEFRVRCEDLPEALLLDPVRVREVLFNLVSNAIKFTDAGSVEVAMSSRPVGAGRHALTIEVRDTGIGMTAAQTERLFNTFTQADASITRTHGGTGLGLAISRALAELMDGGIEVESTPGKGSVFRFAARFDEARAAPEALRGEEEEVTSAGTLRILAVDDNPVNRTIVQTLLRTFGHQITLAQDGIEALEACAEQAFDLILMDIQMPRMDGETALRTLRAGTGMNARTPCIALTANAMASDRERYLAAGFDDHAPKPLDVRQLTSAMARVVALSRDAA